MSLREGRDGWDGWDGGYDSGGQVSAVEGTNLGERFPYVTHLEYDRFGQRVFQQTGNGVQTKYEYDPSTRRLAGLEAGSFQDLAYDYDSVGNITGLRNAIPRGSANELGGPTDQTFGYDALYRLKSATGRFQSHRGHDESYQVDLSYDAIHNVTAKTQEHERHTPGGAAVPQHRTSYAFDYVFSSIHAAFTGVSASYRASYCRQMCTRRGRRARDPGRQASEAQRFARSPR